MTKRIPTRLCALLLAALAAFMALAGCSRAPAELQDGYYTAIAAEFDEHGWKEYLIICVSDKRIVTVEYNAKNASGLIKSWDMQYMRTMNETDGTYPNEYTRAYSDALLSRQDPAQVDMITGATHSHNTFLLLAEAAIAQAKIGDDGIAYVDVPSYE